MESLSFVQILCPLSSVLQQLKKNQMKPIQKISLMAAVAAVALCGGSACADSPKAPTILSILGYEVPDAMRGRNALR